MSLTPTPGPRTGLAPYDRNYGHLRAFQQGTTLANSKPAWFDVMPSGPTIHLWINPQSYTETTQSLYSEVPTLTGVVRLNYGEQPVQIVLEGTTGLAGWDAADHGGMDQLERLKPEDSYADVEVAFHYPYMFRGTRYCYVDEFVQETTPDAPLFYGYRITLSCYDTVPSDRPTYMAVDPAQPSGNPWDCRYSSLNLPWTNPQHPPGYAFDRYVLDKNGNPVPDLDKKGHQKIDQLGHKQFKTQTLSVDDELKTQSIFTPCNTRPAPVKVTPPRPKAKPAIAPRTGPRPV